MADEHLIAVGHRVVHGGEAFAEPVIVDAEVLATIRRLSVLAPLHNPANAEGIERAMAVFPGVPEVAVFDTAFFRTLPAGRSHLCNRRGTGCRTSDPALRLSRHKPRLRVDSAATHLGRQRADINQIVLHLGNGASISAIRGGVAVETSMGLTPLEGLVMGTRSGDVDPGVLLHLQRSAGLDLAAVDRVAQSAVRHPRAGRRRRLP